MIDDNDRPPDDFGSVNAPRAIGLGRDCAGGRPLSDGMRRSVAVLDALVDAYHDVGIVMPKAAYADSLRRLYEADQQDDV